MNKEQLQALGLSDEQVSKVLDGFKGYVPPARFNEVNEAKKNAEMQLNDRDKQLAELKKSMNGNDDLNKQIEALQAENKAARAKYEQDLANFKIGNAIDLALAQHGAKNITAAKALIKMDSIKLDGDKVTGVDEQIKALAEGKDTSFLFESKQVAAKSPTGMTPVTSLQNQHDNSAPMSLYDMVAMKLNE